MCYSYTRLLKSLESQRNVLVFLKKNHLVFYPNNLEIDQKYSVDTVNVANYYYSRKRLIFKGIYIKHTQTNMDIKHTQTAIHKQT